MSKPNPTKLALIEAGKRMILERGFNNTGIDAVLKSVGVPKGSFYHYFASKEDFGLAVVNHYVAEYEAMIDGFFYDESLSPMSRLKRLFEQGCQVFESENCRKGCLVGNLSQELSDQHDRFRVRLEEILTGWRDKITHCLQAAQAAGEIHNTADPQALAEFCLFAWEGAILRAKVTKSVEPMHVFMDVFFNHTLQEAKNREVPHV